MLPKVAFELFDPKKGVKPGQREHGGATFNNVFHGNEAVDWVIANKFAQSRGDAVVLLGALCDRQLFVPIQKQRFCDDLSLLTPMRPAKELFLS